MTTIDRASALMARYAFGDRPRLRPDVLAVAGRYANKRERLREMYQVHGNLFADEIKAAWCQGVNSKLKDDGCHIVTFRITAHDGGHFYLSALFGTADEARQARRRAARDLRRGCMALADRPVPATTESLARIGIRVA